MPVGEQRPFLQLSNSVKTAAVDTAGTTITFSTGAQYDPQVRLQNLGTATIWIGIGTRATSSAAVTANGLMLPPTTVVHALQIIRTGGNTTLAAFTVGATQTGAFLATGGEGLL